MTDSASAGTPRFEVVPCVAWDRKLAFLLRDNVARRESPFLSLDAVSAASLLIGRGDVRADAYLGWSLDGPRNLAFPFTPTDSAIPVPTPARKAAA